MDDRFDFIFFNNDLLSGAKGLTYIANSYKAVGNDGNHYNKSINAAPTNTAAPANVIDALYYMSDHLPIVLKATIPVNVGVDELVIESKWTGFYTGEIFKFKSNTTEKSITVVVYDLLGKMIQTESFSNQNEFQLALNNLKQGMYFVKVITSSNHQETFRILNTIGN